MKPIRLAALALLAVGISCSDSSGPTRPTEQVADIERARQQWRAQGLHTYAFTLQRGCFCANTDRLYVLVLSDTVAGVLDLDTAEMVDRRLGETIDGLFSFIQNAIDRPAQLIRAQYDAVKGFPTEIDYDGAAQIADDEISFRISDVHPIAPPG